jgi:hypothetical protein
MHCPFFRADTWGSVPGNWGASPSPFSRRAHLLPTRKRAVVWPVAIVRSPRGMRLLREPPGNAASGHRLCQRQGASLLESPRRWPAKTCPRQLCRRDGRHPRPCSLLEKRTRKHGRTVRANRNLPYRRAVRANRNLPFGSKNHQPWCWAFRLCSSGIHELFPHLQ